MRKINKEEPLLLLSGDILSFVCSLAFMLVIRYGELPSEELFWGHLIPFSLIFLASLLVFFISGLYEKQTLLFKSHLLQTIINAQVANSILAVLLFYFVPVFGIAPKTNLFLYLVFSSSCILLWRLLGTKLFVQKRKESALLIGSGKEMQELLKEVNENPRYGMQFVEVVDLSLFNTLNPEIISGHIEKENISFIAVDLGDKKVEVILPHLYNLIFMKRRFVDLHLLYEEIFDKIPLSLVKYEWILENISLVPKFGYDFFKRLMDMLISIPLLVVPVLTYPFAFIAVTLEDGGPIFISQERVGQNNKTVKIKKFRSMTRNDDGEYGKTGSSKLEVTKVGAFLRKTRLDEFPQLWNVLKGDLSLIGPRPELPSLVSLYEKEIPYYPVRHLIKPGLSGWAQIYHKEHPHHKEAVTETSEKLSYDLYYLKNRSILLDLKISLRTLKTLLSRSGI